jgi:hypothetical protein
MTRSVLLSFAAAFVAVLLAAAPVSAQVQMQILGGVTRAAATSPFVGGALTARAGWFEIGGEAGRLVDVLPKGLLDKLNELQRQHGLPVRAIASLPATYVMGTVKLISPVGPARPFVAAGFGIARAQPRFDVTVAGISLGDVFGLTSAQPENDKMLALGGGIRLDVGQRASVEAGYRYLRIYSDFRFDPTSRNDKVLTNAHAFYGALGIRF